MKTKLFSLFLALAASVGPICAETYSGTCGANLSWTLNTEDSVLTISGSGNMTNFYFDYSEQIPQTPWNTYLPYIKSVIIEDGVTSIGSWTFGKCTGCTSIAISNSVTSIGERAFSSCKNLTSLYIPSSVTNIGEDAFILCSGLTSIDVATNNMNYCAVNGVLFNKNLTTLIYYPSGKQGAYAIPNSVISIWEYAFNNCAGLTSIEIPSSVTTIGDHAFFYCSGLKSVVIPNSVISIGSYAFYNCSRLTSIVLSSSVSIIGDHAFSGISNWGAITNYASVPQTITSEVFAGGSLSTDTLYVPVQSISAYQAADVWKDFGTILPIDDTPEPCIIASGTCGENLTWTLSCDSVLTISGTGNMTNSQLYAPWYASKEFIKNIVISESVTYIGNNAFYNCTNLTNVTIPNSVTSIGGSAFKQCVKLSNVIISNSVTRIGVGAFADCINLENVTFPNSVTSIGMNAFAHCANFTNVMIPNSVTSIGISAFVDCYKLIEINVATDNPNYCSANGVLLNKTQTTLIQYPGGKKGAYTIPNSVTKIEETAFRGCHYLTSVTIPNNVTTIGGYAFFGSYLTSIEIPNSITSIGDGTFSYCSDLTNVTIPASVTSIGNRAFYYCNKVTCITCKAVAPPTCGSDVFYNVTKTIPLYVPAQSIAAYQTADVWRDFTNILPIEEPIIEPMDSIYDVVYIDQAGIQLDFEPITLHLPEAPEIEGFSFLKWQVVAGDLSAGIYIQALYTINELTDASSVYSNPANPAQKLIRNGNVYILQTDEIYSITGQKVQ